MRSYLLAALAVAATAVPVLTAGQAHADSASSVVGRVQPLNTGAAVYEHVCQGCHMPGGKGAAGASSGFPAFAGDGRLQSAGYPVYMVLNGRAGMPWFAGMLSDKQIADVVNYIRTSFGNHFDGTVKPEDVAKMRQPVQMEEQ
ncbi:cytochrome c precursor [Acetobacter nitrogenifigens DSM 23921 = NBRC 105050]|uniref:Cytochrome c domain-containing protein n=1 Tax=Acetobacter nitrogenifigens DSM 23921 = NBRC 105050 TaxID=1120919 RepID=A0A511X6I3_9PROT|nr:cytochrome c [Acetobacter nitrogenifigens]GBQ99082.1 cytochrome c precursor [Acetobacter nitrogenifigens DSM 23921 = NBRC 105050]GEN58554.1 hypothetical protein ANI02nite_04380 [Acetobacter nitrogenifigens DSM 23921 = NBRC 105050]